MTATDNSRGITTRLSLHLAFELAWKNWKVAFFIGRGRKPRERVIAAPDFEARRREMALARQRFGLPDESEIVAGYVPRRDGFWVYRWLLADDVRHWIAKRQVQEPAAAHAPTLPPVSLNGKDRSRWWRA